ncbi:hypothetical protein [Streptosporangium sp. NPDC048865]|uniref:hypothetical protein n=1 Tax=Streptosporangium sp. NPDC048865 TaxID=3155766 RepID=UPI00344A402E
MPLPDWRAQLAAADARIEHGRAEMAAGGDDRARAIAAGVTQHHRDNFGGRRGTKRLAVAAVAEELLTSVKTVDTALAKVNAGLPSRPGLPWPVWERLAAAELADLAPLPAAHWDVLAHLMDSAFIDEAWIDAPGELLAQEVEDLDTDEVAADVRQALIQACRSWRRAQGLAVLEALARGEQATLPTDTSG